jgi:hypothetical protein
MRGQEQVDVFLFYFFGKMNDLLSFVMAGLVLLAQTAMALETGSSGVCAAGSRVYFRLLEKFDASPDSKLLRFELPQKVTGNPFGHAKSARYICTLLMKPIYIHF